MHINQPYTETGLVGELALSCWPAEEILSDHVSATSQDTEPKLETRLAAAGRDAIWKTHKEEIMTDGWIFGCTFGISGRFVFKKEKNWKLFTSVVFSIHLYSCNYHRGPGG